MPRLAWRRNGHESGPAAASAAAEQLVAEGRILDAIELLTEANRSARDHEIERRLVELRSDAFLSM
jgi:hypothetical protein